MGVALSAGASGGAGIGAAAGGIAGAAVQGLSLIGQRKRTRLAYQRQKKLMGIQYENQRLLNQQGAELEYKNAMDLWNNTNAEAQMEHLKAAGLNPALMYKQGGAQGTTTGGGSGGSAASGSVPAQQQYPMDIGPMVEGMLALAQAAKLKAEAKNIDQDTELKREQEGETRERGIGTYLDNALKRYLRESPDKVHADRSERYGEEGTVHEGSITLETSEAERDRAEQLLENMKAEEQKTLVQTVESSTNEALLAKKIELTGEQTRKIYHDILVNYINAGMKGLDTIVKGRLGSIGAKK